MKISKLIATVLLSTLMLTSCDLGGSPKDLYGQYNQAKKSVQKQDSYTKNEFVDISFKGKDNDFGITASSLLKYSNVNENTWETSFKIGNLNFSPNAFYSDGNAYVSLGDLKINVSIPKLFANPQFLSMINDNDKKNLLTSESVDNADGSKTMTFTFKSDDTMSNIYKLLKLGVPDVEILDVVPGEVTVVATISPDGLLLSEKATFSTDVTINTNGSSNTATLTYSTNLSNSNFNSTEIILPDTTAYQSLELSELKARITEILNTAKSYQK